MIEYFLRLLESRNQSKIDTIAAQMVEASLEEVCTKLSTRCDAMTLSEARGYVRVRAAQAVRRHTRRWIARNPDVPGQWSSSIVRQATERMVPQVLRQLSRSTTTLSTTTLVAPIQLQRAA